MVSGAIQFLYPTAVPGEDYVYVGGADVFHRWNEAKLGPEPTQAALDAVTAEQVTAAWKAKEANIYDFLDRLDARQTAIDADIVLTQGGPTLNQLTRVVRDVLQFEQRELRTIERQLALMGYRKLP